MQHLDTAELNRPADVVLTSAWSAVYVALVLVAVRPLLRRWDRPTSGVCW